MAKRPEPTPGTSDWARVLDELADQLNRLRDCASDDSGLLELSNTPWHPPSGIGDLPPTLAPRAAALVEEMDALRPVLLKRRDETVRQLRAVSSVPRDSSATSVYLDSVG